MNNDDNNNNNGDDTLLDMAKQPDLEDDVALPAERSRPSYEDNNTPTTLFAIPASNTSIDPDNRKTDGVPVVGDVGITTERELVTSRYEILERIGSGAMAEVYRVRDTMISGSHGCHEVALKVVTHDNPWGDQAEDRIKNEVALGRRVVSPYVAQIYDLTKFRDGRWAITQELIRGKTLTKLMQEGLEVDWLRFTGWIIDIAKGLQAAHEVGVVHRDLKPENIIVRDHDDRAMTLDFGVAKLFGRNQVSLTQHGTVVGTLLYMAPEQIRNITDPRSDIFALGLTAVRLITGTVPLSGDGTADGIILARVEQPEPFRLLDVAPNTPPPLADAVDRMLMHHPRDRFPTGADVVEAFQDFLDFGSARTKLTVVADLFPDTKLLTVPPRAPPPPPLPSVRVRPVPSDEVSILPAAYARDATPVPTDTTPARLAPWLVLAFAVLLLMVLMIFGPLARAADGADLSDRPTKAAIQKTHNPRPVRG